MIASPIREILVFCFGVSILYEVGNVWHHYFPKLQPPPPLDVRDITPGQDPDHLYITYPDIGSIEVSISEGTVFLHGKVTMDNAGYLFWNSVMEHYPTFRNALCKHWHIEDHVKKVLDEYTEEAKGK